MTNVSQQYVAPTKSPILTLAVHPHKDWLAIGQLSSNKEDPTLSVVKQQNGEVITIVERTISGEGSVYQTAFHPNGRDLVYVIQRDNSFHLFSYNVKTQESKHVVDLITQHQGLAFDEEGKQLIALGEMLHIWRDGEHETMDLGMNENDTVCTASLSPNGKYLALAGLREGQVDIFDTRTKDKLLTLNTQFKSIGRVEYDHTSHFLGAMNYFGRGVYIWDITTGERHIDDLFSEELALTSSFRFSPISSLLMLGHIHDFVVVYDLTTGDEIFVDQRHRGRVEDVCFSSDGHYAISGGEDHQIVVRQIEST